VSEINPNRYRHRKTCRLTREQAEKLRAQVREKLDWFVKLQKRMEQLGFAESDPLHFEASRVVNVVRDFYAQAEAAVVDAMQREAD
jgi:hypothetical protein